MKEGQNFFVSVEQEPTKEREKFCTYCYDFYPQKAIRTVRTTDGQDEPVCADHVWMLDSLGLAANGTQTVPDQELADYIRDKVIFQACLLF